MIFLENAILLKCHADRVFVLTDRVHLHAQLIQKIFPGWGTRENCVCLWGGGAAIKTYFGKGAEDIPDPNSL